MIWHISFLKMSVVSAKEKEKKQLFLIVPILPFSVNTFVAYSFCDKNCSTTTLHYTELHYT